jgi:hypothetical protein
MEEVAENQPMLLAWLKDVHSYLFTIEQLEDNKAAQARPPKPPRPPKKHRQDTETSRLVRALRAKANDPSVTRAEAAAFAAKADELEKR